MNEVNPILAAIDRAHRRAPGSGRPEATLREEVQPAIEEILRARGTRAAARNEVSLQVPSSELASALDAPLEILGRADAIYNRFVIEFEPPRSLRPSVAHSATRHAVGQVQQYMRGAEANLGLQLDRLAGCAFDGTWIVYVTWERGDFRVAEPVRTDRDSLSALVDTMASLATGRGLTAENLDEDFGKSSEATRLVVKSLTDRFVNGGVSGRGLTMLDQWALDLGNASGPFSAGDLSEWHELCSTLNVPTSESASRFVLFSLQTYFALVAKLVALVVLEGATGLSLVEHLTDDPGSTRQRFADLEAGRLTATTQALNVIEPGVFSWYLGEQDPDLFEALLRMAAVASEYSAEIVEITPRVARDVMKNLYQRLVPRSIRHRLGEYYTPDWLAQRVVNQVTGSETRLSPTLRILDPACGSGTFLTEVISRMVATAGGTDPRSTLYRILDNVVGFDLSPMAVQASKVNYLLALAPLIRHADQPVLLPVFLCDSVSPPRQRGLLEGDTLVFSSSEGDWRVPASLIESRYLPTVGAIFRCALEQGRDVAWVRSQGQAELPLLDNERDQIVLDEVANLFTKLRDLNAADRDGMWWDLLTNAFAPALQGRFDCIVGNPPWVSWETLPEGYRRANDDLWLNYRLKPREPHDRRQASANVPLDLSMLFVARCIDQYLVEGGKLGFVITASVFRSELAGRGFRRRHLPPDGQYSFSHIDDMTSLSIFEGATNQTAVLVAEKRARPRTSPIPVSLWRPSPQRTIPSSLELGSVANITSRREYAAEPVDPLDDTSPMLMMTRYGLRASRPVRQRSPYLTTVRKGIDTRGANGIFFVETLEWQEELVRIRNLPSEGRAAVSSHDGWVERPVVHRLLRGADVARGACAPVLGLLIFHDDTHVSNPIPAAEAASRFPHAFEFMRQFELPLRARRPFRNFDPSGGNWLGIYSVTTAALARDKVVVREIAQGIIAAPVHGEDTIPDHKLYVIPCSSEREANRLARVLNSRVVSYLVLSFSVSTSITGSFLRYVGVRDLSTADEPADPDESIASALGLGVDQYRTLDSIARTELGFLRQAARTAPASDGA